MVTLRTRFDGERIEVPPELRGAAPGDVLVVYLNTENPATTVTAERRSVWETVGKALHPRSAAEINASVRADRDSWDER